MTLGEKLSKLRKENNYTQEQLADVLGVSRQAISKWESNITYPETDKLIRISELFHCSLDYLLKETEEIYNKNQYNEAGILSLGLLSLGLLSFGLFALGILSAGSISLGVFSAGSISLGIISLGAIAIGDFSVGALAVGKYFALGDNARAMIALGDSEAAGNGFQKIGEFSAQDIVTVKQSLDTIVPTYLSWAKEIIKLFL